MIFFFILNVYSVVDINNSESIIFAHCLFNAFLFRFVILTVRNKQNLEEDNPIMAIVYYF